MHSIFQISISRNTKCADITGLLFADLFTYFVENKAFKSLNELVSTQKHGASRLYFGSLSDQCDVPPPPPK